MIHVKIFYIFISFVPIKKKASNKTKNPTYKFKLLNKHAFKDMLRIMNLILDD